MKLCMPSPVSDTTTTNVFITSLKLFLFFHFYSNVFLHLHFLHLSLKPAAILTLTNSHTDNAPASQKPRLRHYDGFWRTLSRYAAMHMQRITRSVKRIKVDVKCCYCSPSQLGTHKPHGITQCYLPPGRSDIYPNRSWYSHVLYHQLTRLSSQLIISNCMLIEALSVARQLHT